MLKKNLVIWIKMLIIKVYMIIKKIGKYILFNKKRLKNFNIKI